MKPAFRLTYQVVTEESAIHGDFDRTGFVPEDLTVPAKGNHMPATVPQFRLREAVKFLLNRESQGRVEADSCPVSLSSPPRWFSYGGAVDGKTREAVTVSLHLPKTITPSSAIRIARLLKCYGVKAVDRPKPAMPSKAKRRVSAKEYKVVALRDCPLPESMHLCDTPDKAAEYWRHNVTGHAAFNPEVECFAVLLLNTRRRAKGHVFVATGTLDTLLVHPREVFRAAIIAAASAIILMHNHPSGESAPSEADIKVTRDLIRAGQLLKIDVLDHVIMGAARHTSLRELGYFYS